MECPRQDEEVLSAFVDGETPAGQQRTVARHLLNCEKCAAETGRLLAVRSYLGAEPETTGELSGDFWGRLHRALRLADEVATAPVRRAERRLPAALSLAVQPRVAWAVTAASLVLAMMVLFTARSGSPTVAPGMLAQTHQFDTGSYAATLPWEGSNLQPVGWEAAPQASGGGVWLPRPSWGPSPLPRQVEQDFYTGAGMVVSRFRLVAGALDVTGMKHLRVGEVDYYAGRQGFTTVLARRAEGYWLVLTADVPVDDLLAFAEQYGELVR